MQNSLLFIVQGAVYDAIPTCTLHTRGISSATLTSYTRRYIRTQYMCVAVEGTQERATILCLLRVRQLDDSYFSNSKVSGRIKIQYINIVRRKRDRALGIQTAAGVLYYHQLFM